MSFRMSFHLAPLGLTGAHWLDDPSDLSCKDGTRQHPVDDPLSCKQQVGGSSPPASSQTRAARSVLELAPILCGACVEPFEPDDELA